MTPRTLETLIRLTIAHAKCRLSRSAELQDAEAACDVMNFALYNEVRVDPPPPPMPGNRPVPVDGPSNGGGNSPARPGEKRPADRDEEELIGDKRERPEDEIRESNQDRARRCRRLVKKVMADRKLENCEMLELIRWMDEEQSARGAKYRPWQPDEVWAELESWAAEEDPSGVMVDRAINEIFSL